MRRWIHKAIFICLFATLGVIVHMTQRAMDRHKEIRFVDTRPVFLPKGEVLKWLSMGYRGLMSDWLWIRTVLYYGRRVMDDDNPYYVYSAEQGNLERELDGIQRTASPLDSIYHLKEELKHILYQGTNRGLVNYIYPMLDRVTTVDPHFVFPYIFGGVYVMMDTGEIEKGLHLLQKGYAANPDRWEFPLYLGWIEWMYLGNLEKTSRYLLEAVGKEGCPEYVGRLLTGLSRNLDRAEMTRLYLESLLESTENPEVRAYIEDLLQQIGN